jgi:hypothetical protein
MGVCDSESRWPLLLVVLAFIFVVKTDNRLCCRSKIRLKHQLQPSDDFIVALPRKRMRDYTLRMSDVWEMAKSNRRFRLRSRKVRKKKQSNYCCYSYFHTFGEMGRFVLAKNVTP